MHKMTFIIISLALAGCVSSIDKANERYVNCGHLEICHGNHHHHNSRHHHGGLHKKNPEQTGAEKRATENKPSA